MCVCVCARVLAPFFSRSAKFLEDNDKAITALQRKEALKVIDVDNSGKMALIEYLLWKYKKTVSQVANASQGFQFLFKKSFWHV